MNFTEYVEMMMKPRVMEDGGNTSWYYFGNNDYITSWTNFTEHYNRVPIEYEREPFFSFGIGGSGSGVPFHTHGAVFAEVLHGQKRWFLTHPDHKPIFNPDETSYRWLLNVLPELPYLSKQQIWDCTLSPNEVLWIDAQWWHSTLNLGDTVFISTFL
eukprot:m.168183 g.168183  ORF g.168183 m.168183 type:complete len:157 (-) comp14471_c0_seq9:74-544(-)